MLYRLIQISPTVQAIGVQNQENLIQPAQSSSISAATEAWNNTPSPS